MTSGRRDCGLVGCCADATTEEGAPDLLLFLLPPTTNASSYFSPTLFSNPPTLLQKMHASVLATLALAVAAVKAIQVTSPDKETVWGTSGSHVRFLPPSLSIRRPARLTLSNLPLSALSLRFLPLWLLWLHCLPRSLTLSLGGRARLAPLFSTRPPFRSFFPPWHSSPPASFAQQTIEWEAVSTDADSFDVLLVNFVSSAFLAVLPFFSARSAACGAQNGLVGHA